MKRHIEAKTSPGKRPVYLTSVRQNINTRISTVDYMMPMVLWIKYLLDSHRYDVNKDISQDNQSSIMLKRNGSSYSVKRTRHINITYFIVPDIITF